MRKKVLEKEVKVTIKENVQKKKVTLKVLDNVACKYPDPKIYIEENLTEKVRSFILSDALP